LYHFAELVIFPSTYEGFGLPLIKSLFHSKKVVVLDNEINREISNEYGKEDFLFFKTYDEIRDHILNCKKTPFRKNNQARTWEDVADDTEKFVEEILNTKIDSKALGKRWYSLLSIEQQIREKDQQIIAWKHELNKVINRRFYKTLDHFFQKTRIYKLYGRIKELGK
jgi:hypothetical protein